MVVENISTMVDRVSRFDGRCKALPKKLREWDAYAELRREIGVFQEVRRVFAWVISLSLSLNTRATPLSHCFCFIVLSHCPSLRLWRDRRCYRL
jgi:hypothetical protein